ncbi:MAG: hypothetical protein A3K19_07855 [Lentisphaerae bacterium RIFOXYB12_FULL_65_16]|nr:MAG: hypothetical protein A3K18_31730 [Lentisphaerae bacterium RIFOXYA12_64_32]OGV87565.1 MAG: hypothetical protein A3K19_07855 [Lentisphaerae bacterium RIFOXYB12_FULL_65_16]
MTEPDSQSTTCELRIELPADAGSDTTLVCTRRLRDVPGRRHVYEAMWGDLAVVAKLFCHPTRAAGHARREVRGLAALRDRAVPAPMVLYAGQLNDGSHVVITLRLETDVTPARAVTADRNEAVPWLDVVLLAIANLHAKGALQRDLHPDNLLISRGQVCFLDPALVRLSPRAVPRRTALSQVALLLSQFPRLTAADRRALTETYAIARGWRPTAADSDRVEHLCLSHTRERLRRALKKCQRSNTREVHATSAVFEAVFDRRFLGARASDEVAAQLDATMAAGVALKAGRTCSLARVDWDSASVVIKRYNPRGTFHAARHTLKGSRARRHWLNSHRLLMLGIPTPRPLAFVEVRQGLLVVCSYFIMEFIAGRELRDMLLDPDTAEADKQAVVAQVDDMLRCLGRFRLTHSDLKHRNFLVCGREVFLTDLDGMHEHGSALLYARARRRDLARFARNWDDTPEIGKRFTPLPD